MSEEFEEATSGDDSDAFEHFLSTIQDKKSSKQKYRYSTGSLDDFIADADLEIDDDEDTSTATGNEASLEKSQSCPVEKSDRQYSDDDDNNDEHHDESNSADDSHSCLILKLSLSELSCDESLDKPCEPNSELIVETETSEKVCETKNLPNGNDINLEADTSLVGSSIGKLFDSMSNLSSTRIPNDLVEQEKHFPVRDDSKATELVSSSNLTSKFRSQSTHNCLNTSLHSGRDPQSLTQSGDGSDVPKQNRHLRDFFYSDTYSDDVFESPDILAPDSQGSQNSSHRRIQTIVFSSSDSFSSDDETSKVNISPLKAVENYPKNSKPRANVQRNILDSDDENFPTHPWKNSTFRNINSEFNHVASYTDGSSDDDIPSLSARLGKTSLNPERKPSHSQLDKIVTKNPFVIPQDKPIWKKLPKTVVAPSPRINLSTSSSSDDEVPSLLSRVKNPAAYPGRKSSDDQFDKIHGKNPFVTPRNKPIRKQLPQTIGGFSQKNVCQTKGCFLADLDHPISQNSGIGFKRRREQLTKELFKLLNDSVFDSRLPADMEVAWDKRLRKTAGNTKCRRITKRENVLSGISATTVTYEASISLSEKVLTTAGRLRDTLIHEMCHAAVWVLDNANDNHGPLWKSWARKSTNAHPELPIISRCHSYDIEFKFRYTCTRCQSTIGRHSKSIDMTKQFCGRCRGTLTLSSSSSSTPRTPNAFASFVKENYKTTRQQMSDIDSATPHKDVMKALSEKFRTSSIS